MASIHRRLRPYRQAGLYRGRTGPPPAPTPTQQRSIATLRTDQLVADHLQNDPTGGQQVILDLLTFAEECRTATPRRTCPRCLVPRVDRRSHRAWQVVHDLRRLERHIARLMLALVEPGLERRLAPPEDLAAYIARNGAEQSAAGSPESAPADPASDDGGSQEQGACVKASQARKGGRVPRDAARRAG